MVCATKVLKVQRQIKHKVWLSRGEVQIRKVMLNFILTSSWQMPVNVPRFGKILECLTFTILYSHFTLPFPAISLAFQPNKTDHHHYQLLEHQPGSQIFVWLHYITHLFQLLTSTNFTILCNAKKMAISTCPTFPDRIWTCQHRILIQKINWICV